MTNLIQKRVSALTDQDYDKFYVLTYEDGRQEILHGSDSKLIIHVKWRDGFRSIKVAELVEYLQIKTNEGRIYSSLPEVEGGEEAGLVIPPYLMGVLLGDGNMTGYTMGITSIDPEVISRCESVLPVGFKLKRYKDTDITYQLQLDGITRNYFNPYLNSLGLKVTSEKKFIPKEYLLSSYNQRLELIKGLMDTDGTIDVGGTSSFSSSSHQLATDFQYLIRSIGGLAKITSRVPHFTHKGVRKEGMLAYRVWSRVANPTILFSLPRKLARAPEKNQYSDRLKLRIKSVEPIYE